MAKVTQNKMLTQCFPPLIPTCAPYRTQSTHRCRGRTCWTSTAYL